ncbi:MAG: SGNH/GDSL hydrolase family protein [Planctomycetota bacterium]
MAQPLLSFAQPAADLASSVAFHNTPELAALPGHGPNGLVRLPQDLRSRLNERARFIAMDSVGCEVRFVCDAANIDVYLSTTKPEFSDRSEIRVFRGNFEIARYLQAPGTVQHYRLGDPPNFKLVDRPKLQQGGFAENVYRVCFNRGGTAHLHGIVTHGHPIRPPKPEELPRLRWLAYGSSITNSSLDGYPHTAARLLRLDVQNKGMSGSCHCEREMADWLADEAEWDLITCELGINMRGGFTAEQFQERVTYLLTRLTDAHPDKPVFAIDVFPNYYTEGWVSTEYRDNPDVKNDRDFVRIVRKVVDALDRPKLHYIQAHEILDDFTYLGGDLLHPGEFGQHMMGVRLAEKLRPIVAGL